MKTINVSVEKITAQDSRNNQSQLYFNSFNEEELVNVFENTSITASSLLSIRTNIITDFLKRTDYIINKSRLSVDSKNFVKSTISLLLDIIAKSNKDND